MGEALSTASVNPEADLVLQVKNLGVNYQTYRGTVCALSGVSIDVKPSKIIAIVGESGSGKSTFGLGVIGLLPRPPARIASGEIRFLGKDMLRLTEEELTMLRGTGLSMIFQEPLSSLDPVYTVGEQLMEAIDVREKRIGKPNYGPFGATEQPREPHRTTSRLLGLGMFRSRMKLQYEGEVIQSLKDVQISDPERVAEKYPHELSGGMVQRVMIASALLEKPSLLIADEPTSALDVTTQAQVLELMRRLKEDIGTSILFITHDLAVAAQIADEVVVMYAGEVVEKGSTKDLFGSPLHPYTEGLLGSFPRKYKDSGPLQAISGDVPDLMNLPSGCRFHPRCVHAFEKCRVETPRLEEAEPSHLVSCFLREQRAP